MPIVRHHSEVHEGGSFPAFLKSVAEPHDVQTVIFTPSISPQPVMAGSNESLELSDILEVSPKDAEKPLPLRSLLTRPVVISIANYAMLSLLEMVSLVLIPLIWSTSLTLGGLGLSPVSIGLYMSIYGCMDGILQFAVSPYAIRRFGPRRVFIAAIAASAVVYIMFPLENFVLRHIVRGASVTTWLLVFLQLSALSIVNMGYCKFICFLILLGVCQNAEPTPNYQAPCICL